MKALPWVIVAVLGLVGVLMYGCQERRAGELDQRVKARETVIASLAAQKAQVDTEYVRGKVVYQDAVTEWDSLKLTLGEKVKLNPLALAGDRVVAGCGTLVASCEARNRLSDSIIAVQVFQIEDLEKVRPSWFRRTFGCAAGAAATTSGVGLGAACGIRFP